MSLNAKSIVEGFLQGAPPRTTIPHSDILAEVDLESASRGWCNALRLLAPYI